MIIRIGYYQRAYISIYILIIKLLFFNLQNYLIYLIIYYGMFLFHFMIVDYFMNYIRNLFLIVLLLIFLILLIFCNDSSINFCLVEYIILKSWINLIELLEIIQSAWLSSWLFLKLFLNICFCKFLDNLSINHLGFAFFIILI